MREPTTNERRSAPDPTVGLVVILESAGRPQRAELHRLSETAAVVEASLPLDVGAAATLRCGSLKVDGLVTPEADNCLRLTFLEVLDGMEIARQILRANPGSSMGAPAAR